MQEQVQKIGEQIQVKPEKKTYRRPRKRVQERSYKRWSKEENHIYAIFLLQNLDDFSSQWNRRSTKVYLRLSRLIKTKNINQCKSHHQKMISYCGDLKNVIKKFLGNKSDHCSNVEQSFSSEKKDENNCDYIKMQQKQFYMRQLQKRMSMFPFPPVPMMESHPIFNQGQYVKLQNNQTQSENPQFIQHPFPPYPFHLLPGFFPMPMTKEECGDNLKEQEGVPNILKLKIHQKAEL